ncbi:MAG: NFACT family protein [Lachnospiraceae bacterium]|nr:NFACT family protein [Lachnospiraceae bacterium]
MALDGITIRALKNELAARLVGGRISKIVQPEADELLLTIKTQAANERLLISAGASLPFVYLSDENKQAPMTAPNFCMLLRKHISGGHLVDITQPGLERIIEFTIEHLDEMGDLCQKIITVELMGKHSNIIFRRTDGTIIDSIKHVSSAVSSVREVLPGREYFIPKAEDKLDLHNYILCNQENGSAENLSAASLDVLCKPIPLSKSLYTTFTGFSPVLSESLCELAGLDSSRSANSFDESELCKLYDELVKLDRAVEANDFRPAMISDEDGNPAEFEVIPLSQYANDQHRYYDTVSEMLISYYARSNEYTRIRQKSADLRKIVTTAIERNVKKYDLQEKQLKDTEKMDKFRLYGELLQTYGYSAEEGADKLTCENYYDGKEVTIPLDPTLSAMENSVKYFDRYQKLKRTKEAVTAQLAETGDDIEHLQSVLASLDIAEGEADLAEIREELSESGYIKHRPVSKKKGQAKSRPLSYISSDGFHIYVGKNNFQNEEITFKVANAGDWWFHAKKMPGSHVIVKCEGKELPDRAFEEAACLAAYYSSGRSMGKVEVDYVRRREIKKPGGAKPGFVIYHTNYSMTADAVIPEGVTADN